jgi:hypothetical protein
MMSLTTDSKRMLQTFEILGYASAVVALITVTVYWRSI